MSGLRQRPKVRYWRTFAFAEVRYGGWMGF